MKIKIYQIDAFSDQVFRGNPAAVCILDYWLDESTMQLIAAENNLAETAFVVKEGKNYAIRWFTPNTEVDLCGHATLAAAHVLFKYYHYKSSTIKFDTKKSGILIVRKDRKKIELDFPADQIEKVATPDILVKALGCKPIETYKGKTDYMLIFDAQSTIELLKPDFRLLNKIKARGIIVSAKGEIVDFVSRFFAPQVGIDEDPVTGSAHTTLAPYWANKLNKTALKAQQLSKRKGELECVWDGDRVKISGHAVTYLIGEIEF
ncbi:MAG: PhzF family phenazine biosynthesis protein [Bacteroidetes bacterium]|nr:PhzF family phenazine biosynthesis protein [Bacteroidota bacterium]